MDQREKELAAVAEALGKPAGFDISDPAVKVRKSLMAASVALLCLVIAKIEPSDTFTIFGVAFKGVTADKIVIGAMIVLTYSLAHFLFYVVELLGEYRVRMTGARVAFQTGARAGSAHVDYPDDPKQSSLANWWKSYARRLHSVGELTDRLSSDLDEIKHRLGSPDEIKGSPDDIATSQLMGQVNANLMNLRNEIQTSREVVLSPRIEVSLERFESWYKGLMSLQGFRVLVVEVALPILLGLISLTVATRYLLAL
ncbi:hypothetical protein K8374_08805 [Pseudomonas sp. p1(2021b)]|uniref:hypothetical protein n=1 Tax=Pseudomonas sp. p1(2021b) TaxID=2874628 RepID=UPI001CCD8760|nr:hypothetical protein [Pseudomonas sp. p1(2021b)]UBM27043.1 hypothetical protein K8374_08805 [Pseudomonas sp. p1(2021b)]